MPLGIIKYDLSEYTADELAQLIASTADQIATFKKFYKLTRAERQQIAHDESLVAQAVDELCKRDSL